MTPLRRMSFQLLAMFVLMMAALLSGCAAPGPLFSGWDTPPPGKALLYVYRHPNFQPDMVYTVTVDGVEVGPVYHDGYLVTPMTQVEHVVQVYEATYLAPATQPLKLNVKAGEIYPVEYDTSGVSFDYSGPNLTPLMRGRRRIVLRSMGQAFVKIQNLKRFYEAADKYRLNSQDERRNGKENIPTPL